MDYRIASPMRFDFEDLLKQIMLIFKDSTNVSENGIVLSRILRISKEIKERIDLPIQSIRGTQNIFVMKKKSKIN